MGKVWDFLAPRNLELGPLAAAPPGEWRHFRLARDDNGVAWLMIDKEGASANTLSEEVLAELLRSNQSIALNLEELRRGSRKT